jgi:hypothetical protein
MQWRFFHDEKQENESINVLLPLAPFFCHPIQLKRTGDALVVGAAARLTATSVLCM